MKLLRWCKANAMPVIAVLAAAVTAVFVPPDAAYLGYYDVKTLSCLLCVLAVVGALRRVGLFPLLAQRLVQVFRTTRGAVTALIGITLVGSMLLTNDTALLTFLPLSWFVLERTGQTKWTALTFILQNCAANLGGMLIPFGNPQNLYLASAFSVSTGTFLMRMLPLTALSLILLVAAACMLPSASVDIASQPVEEQPEPKKLAVYLALFVVCLGCVSHLIPYPVMLVLVLVTLLFTNRALFHKADYFLLLTFVFFFLFIGNVQNIPAVSDLLHKLIRGRELGAGILLSQCISNVPAAILLSSFTDQVTPLLYGVNIGGLGTLIASLASLISYRFYVGTENAHTGRYMKVFTLYNVVFLVILAFVAWKIL